MKVFITGATSGIGRLSALKFLELGHDLILHGRSEEALLKLEQEARSRANAEQRIWRYQADLSKSEDVDRLINQVRSDHKELDILINNAGLGPKHEKIIDVNYIALVLLCENLLPLIAQARGRIVNIASEAQATVQNDKLAQLQGMTAYAQSKLAVIMYTKKLAERIEEDGQDVIVTSLDPGSFLATKMVKETYGRDGRDPMIGVNAHLKLATAEAIENGSFYSEGEKAQAHPDAYNQELINNLWTTTQELIS